MYSSIFDSRLVKISTILSIFPLQQFWHNHLHRELQCTVGENGGINYGWKILFQNTLGPWAAQPQAARTLKMHVFELGLKIFGCTFLHIFVNLSLATILTQSSTAWTAVHISRGGGHKSRVKKIYFKIIPKDTYIKD